MGVPQHLIVLMCDLCCGKQTTVRIEYGETEWCLIGKGVRQRCVLCPDLFSLYAEHIIRKARLDSDEKGMKIGGRAINILRHADSILLLTESSNDLKQLLMNVRKESARAGLWLSVKKTKVMTTEELHKF